MKVINGSICRKTKNDRIYGQVDYKFKLLPGWIQMPEEMIGSDIPGVYCDNEDYLYVMTRNFEMPIVVFSPDGQYVRTMGKGLFVERPHGMYINDKNEIYCTDDKADIVLKLDREGNLLKKFGSEYVKSDTGCTDVYKELWDREVIPHNTKYDMPKALQLKLDTIVRTAPPFNGPTRMIEIPSGELICTDGYGNAAVHFFDKNGDYVKTIGKPGREIGSFRLPHSVWYDAQERLWIADRENSRVQVFNMNGDLLACIEGLYRPADLWSDGEVMYVGELDGGITILDMDINIVSQLGYKFSPLMIHGLCGDSKGNLYAASLDSRCLCTVTKLERIR